MNYLEGQPHNGLGQGRENEKSSAPMSLFGILELENRKFNILQFISVCELYAVVGTGLAAQTSHRSYIAFESL